MAYQYLTLSDSKIRLLALLPGRLDDPLRSEIFEAEFSSNPDISPRYEALSYAWGHQANTQPLYIIRPDGSFSGTIDFAPNIHSALHHLHLEASRRIIWCDLISINQVDLKEQENEILRMADIYRKAQRVVIWLGPKADKSALAIKAIEYAEIPHSQQELEAIQKLVARSWFKRLWVRQEVTLARSAVVIVGDRKVSWTHLISAAAFLDTFIRLRRNSDPTFGRDLLNLVEFGFVKSYDDIMDIFHPCRACECTEDHDRVYALLGFLSTEQSLAIQPDYSKGAKNVYQDLVMQYYEHHQRLHILTLCEVAETPSWVPDLQKLRLNTGLNTRVAQYCWASGEAAASLVLSADNAIETCGIRCGTPGKNISSSIDKNNQARVLKHAIVLISRDHMGIDVSRWDDRRLEILTKGPLGCIWFERTGRMNHARLSFALSELRKWALEPNDVSDHLPDEHESLVLMNHIARVIFKGDSCRWTQDSHLGLGYSACQEGDVLYAILGC
ncbi:heterokaryon incompatibility protein-domain-containing protein [Ilyonectria destructans]|nr:heterokaryon incompatibility protein-domain-containing protein [Ilyonectria destructans]